MESINRKNHDLIDRYLDECAKWNGLSPASKKRYELTLKGYLLHWAQEADFSSLGGKLYDFSDWLSKYKKKNGKPLVYRTQKKAIQLTKLFLKWCKQGFHKEFRAMKFEQIERMRTRGIKPEIIRDHVDLDEMLKIANIKVLDGDITLMRDVAIAVLAYISGARAAELATLPIKAIHLIERYIDIDPALGVKAKNNQPRTVDLLNIPELMEPVYKWDEYVRERLPLDAPWFSVITHKWGDPALTPNQPGTNRAKGLNKRLKRVMGIAGIKPRSTHQFRRGYAIEFSKSSTTELQRNTLRLSLGHSSTATTDKYYLVPNQKERKQATDDVSKIAYIKRQENL